MNLLLSKASGAIAVCYMDHLLVFQESKEKIDQQNGKLRGDLIMKYLKALKSFQGTEQILKRRRVPTTERANPKVAREQQDGRRQTNVQEHERNS